MTKARKTIVTLMIPLILLLLLTACQPGMVDNADPTESTTPSSSITPPTDSVVPPTSTAPTTPTSEPQTTQPTITPNSSTGYAHIHKEYISPGLNKYDFSDCTVGYLYWLDKDSHNVTLLLAEQTARCVAEGMYIYYVKEAEPTKIYRILIANPSQSELVYESTYGNITYVDVTSDLNGLLQFVADEKKFVVYDMATGESTLLMEQYYINCAWMYGMGDGSTWSEIIEFEGKHTENDSPYTIYVYNYVTGVLELGDK